MFLILRQLISPQLVTPISQNLSSFQHQKAMKTENTTELVMANQQKVKTCFEIRLHIDIKVCIS